MAPRLGAVAAALHGAPAPLAGAAVVEEQPAAFGLAQRLTRSSRGPARRSPADHSTGASSASAVPRLHVDIPAIGAALAPGARCAPGAARTGLVQRLEVARGGRLVLRFGVSNSRALQVSRSSIALLEFASRAGGLATPRPPLAAVQPARSSGARRVSVGSAWPRQKRAVDEPPGKDRAHLHRQDLITGLTG